jgi:hypothetical protein
MNKLQLFHKRRMNLYPQLVNISARSCCSNNPDTKR